MKLLDLTFAFLWAGICSAGLVRKNGLNSEEFISFSPLEKRQGFNQGEPIDAQGKGAPFSGSCFLISVQAILLTYSQDGTNHQIDLENPDNLGAADTTDNGIVPNLKWPFSDSNTRLYKGGWLREQVVTDLPSSPDIAAAQLHLTKGALRELHWHSIVCVQRGICHIEEADFCSLNGAMCLPDHFELRLWTRMEKTRLVI